MRAATAVGVLALAAGLYQAAPLLFRGVFRLASSPLDALAGSAPALDLADTSLLKGKRALVVGGTRGIGRGIALTLATSGASVSIVGRSQGDAVVRTMTERAGDPAAAFRSHSFDLSTVSGCLALVAELGAQGDKATAFDYVFFTVGVWPNFAAPLTADGVDKVVALDLLARHVLLKNLASHGMLRPSARVMNTLASTQNFPLLDADWVKTRLSGPPPGNLFSALVPVSVAADAYLQHAAMQHPGITFVGMFPGIVVTDLPASTFPAWMLPVLHAVMGPIAITEEESGAAHVAVLTSPNVAVRPVTYFNYLLEGRETHPLACTHTKQSAPQLVPGRFLTRVLVITDDKVLVEWVWDFLEDSVSKATNAP